MCFNPEITFLLWQFKIFYFEIPRHGNSLGTGQFVSNANYLQMLLREATNEISQNLCTAVLNEWAQQIKLMRCSLFK